MKLDLTKEEIELTCKAIHQQFGLFDALEVSGFRRHLPGFDQCKETYILAAEMWRKIDEGRMREELRESLKMDL